MFKPVPSKVNFPEMEERILALWRERNVFRRSIEERPPDRLFVFYEGPPTANASPGVHHVLSRVFKDVIPRFRTMRGYRVPRKAGWDTHGLPVELEVERALDLKSKPDIERFGVEEFNRRCRESVVRYVREWEALTERIAFWLDTENPYQTFDNSYIETGWWIIKRLWDGGLIFQDYRSAPHCPRCGTTLSDAEVAQGYQENTPDPSIYVKFRLRSEDRTDPVLRLSDGVPTYILAWTTTPWTLPGNTALAVAPDEPYVLAEVEGERGRERFVLALPLLQESVPGEKQVLAEFPGRVLVGLAYEPLYEPTDWGVPAMRFQEGRLAPLPPGEAGSVPRPVIAAPFVSMTDGTGVVHIAPAFGADDFEIGKQENLLYLQPVDLRGQMVAKGTPFDGLFVKDADPLVLEDLQQRGLLYRSGTIRHTYPFCWRCGTPLLYYAKPCWYIRTTAVKELLVSGNDQINWYPEHIKYGRYGDWLANNVDWALSRERYWGTPLPLWRCEGCERVDCIGSVAELRERAIDPAQVDALSDLHRPYVDAVLLRCQACGGTMRRLPEVADAWFDSGAMPYAQWHYPFENQETFQAFFPADFICEAVDQTRGWFYTLHAEAAVLHSVGAVPAGIAFKNVICLGHIQDDQGRKMSKSLGNQVEPWSVIRDHGADALRWYLYTASPPGNPRRFSQDLVGEALRRFLLTLWNTYSFFVTYALIDRFQPEVSGQAEPSELDRWVLSELHRLVERVTGDLEGYRPTEAGRAIQAFVDDLSNWYVRRSRRRFWKSEDDADKRAAYDTLYRCLVTLCHLLAPFTPFLAEEMYQNLVRSIDSAAPDSVHLAFWPEADPSQVDERLAEDMRLVMRIASLGRAARSKAGVKIRQPLSTLYVKLRSRTEAEALSRLQAVLLDELNVKDVTVVESEEEFLSYQVKPDLSVLGPRYGNQVSAIQEALRGADPASVARAVASGAPVRIDGWELTAGDVLVSSVDREGYASAEEAGYTVVVATSLTPELAVEGLAREVVHRLQTMRRNAGFEIADRIVTYYQGGEALRRVMQRFADYLRQETLSLELVEGEPPPGAHVETHTVDGQEVTLAVQQRAQG
jgi:isoleucyl-tRNA synthetase